MRLDKRWYLYIGVPAVVALAVLLFFVVRWVSLGGRGDAMQELFKKIDVLERKGDYKGIYNTYYDGEARKREALDSFVQRSERDELDMGKFFRRELVRVAFAKGADGAAVCYVTALATFARGRRHEEYYLKKSPGGEWLINYAFVPSGPSNLPRDAKGMEPFFRSHPLPLKRALEKQK